MVKLFQTDCSEACFLFGKEFLFMCFLGFGCWVFFFFNPSSDKN